MMSRRRFLGAAAGAAVGATLERSASMSHARTSSSPNVLMIVVDDLNDWIGPLGGHPQVATPHLDRLAERGFVFANASCPAPICTPARTAVLTGRHPASTGLYFLTPLFRDVPTLTDAVTLPQHFRRHGYTTAAVGKVFHGSNDAESFPEYGGWTHSYGPTPETKLSLRDGHPLWDWGAYPADGRPMPDDRITDWAIDWLGRPIDGPWFLGVGLFRPHVPMYAPPAWFDRYPPGQTAMPPAPGEGDAAINSYARDLTHAAVAPRHDDVVALGQWEHGVRSYLASVSYMDHQIGRLLEALERSGAAADTIVVLWSDHGFHVGERRRWGKRSLWEESCRVPLVVAGPGIGVGRTDAPVGTIDLYPTLNELCGLPSAEPLDGHSLVGLINHPRLDWPRMAVTTFGPGNHAVRSRQHRYIRYADGSQELYDHARDPNEWRNLAAEPGYADVIAAHRAHLPARDAALAPGSAGSDSPLFP